MKRSSNGRTLRIAIAASIAVHLAIASVVRSSMVTAAPEPKVTHGSIVVKLPKPTPTPPPPRERPRPRRIAHAARPAIHLVKQQSKNNPNTHVSQVTPNIEPTGNPNYVGDLGTPGPVTTEAPLMPTPSPTPKPACSAPDIPAKTVDAVSAQAPPDTQTANTTAKIKVDLDAGGNVTGTSVYESTGSMQLDHAALAAARESRYSPEEKNCKNVAGSYLFTVDFQE